MNRVLGTGLLLASKSRAFCSRVQTAGRLAAERAAGRFQPMGIHGSVIALLVSLVLCATAAYAVDPTQMPTPALQARFLALTHELRCMQCQNEAIADSPVDLAADLRRQVREMLLAGR